MSADPVRQAGDTVTVRLARPGDDAELLALELRPESWPPGTGFPSFWKRPHETFFSERSTPEQHLVAEYAGRLVGYVRVLPGNPLPEATHVQGIFGLVVAAEVRGRGVASTLLREAETLARSRGGRKLMLRVLGTNPKAQRLYQRHGFEIEGRFRKEFLIDGEYVDDIAMAKQLV
jgi:ribosomal protein S18 acetylase RimI-like enzyme